MNPDLRKPPHPTQNHLLALLPETEAERLFPRLDIVELSVDEHVYESGERLTHAYFPTTAIVSLLYSTVKGASAEMIGNEGMVGIALFMGGENTPNQAVVGHAGQAYLLKGQELKQEFDRGETLRYLVLRYTQARLTQVMQNVVCTRCHSIDQQLCRLLLMGLDRLPPNDRRMDQELIDSALAAPLDVMTEAVEKLQRAGLVHSDPGWIRVLDRQGLESRVCECYGVVRGEFRRLLPHSIRERAGTPRSTPA